TVRVFTQRIAFHWRNLSRLPLRGRIAYLDEKVKNRRSKAFLETLNEQAGCAYRPAPYSGELTLFQPLRNYDFLDKPSMGWTGLAANLEVIEMPVYPGGLFVEPYVEMLATELRKCIDRTLAADYADYEDCHPKESA